jgi:hypothetical protein
MQALGMSHSRVIDINPNLGSAKQSRCAGFRQQPTNLIYHATPATTPEGVMPNYQRACACNT